MDLERSIGGKNGVPGAYKFIQSTSTCTITFSVKKGVKPQITINQEDSSILVVNEKLSFILCGITYGKFFKNKITNENDEYKITLYKEDRTIWPLLIKKNNSHGIDMKSIYIIGLQEDARGNYKEAFDLYVRSAKEGFVPAIVLVADNYMSDINNYGVVKNIREGISLLQSIPVENMTPDIINRLSKELINQGMKDESKDVLRRYISVKNDNKVAMVFANHLSTFGDGELSDPIEAVNLLEKLSNENISYAKRLLAQHYYKGIGVKKDKNKAKELDQMACQLNNELTPLYSSKGMEKNIAIATGVSALFVGFCATAYKRFNK